MRRLNKSFFGLFREQTGLNLIEVLVAVALLGAIGTVFLTALGSVYKNVEITEEKQQAEALARSQLEYIKHLPYSEDGAYPVTVELPPQYSMVINTSAPTCIGTSENCTSLETLIGSSVDTIQEIKVFVYHGNNPVLSVACYKVKS